MAHWAAVRLPPETEATVSKSGRVLTLNEEALDGAGVEESGAETAT